MRGRAPSCRGPLGCTGCLAASTGSLVLAETRPCAASIDGMPLLGGGGMPSAQGDRSRIATGSAPGVNRRLGTWDGCSNLRALPPPSFRARSTSACARLLDGNAAAVPGGGAPPHRPALPRPELRRRRTSSGDASFACRRPGWSHAGCTRRWTAVARRPGPSPTTTMPAPAGSCWNGEGRPQCGRMDVPLSASTMSRSTSWSMASPRSKKLQLERRRRDVYDFLRYCRSHDLPVVQPHPLYFYAKNRQPPQEIFEKFALLFERFEVCNGQREAWQNLLAWEWVQSLDRERLEALRPQARPGSARVLLPIPGRKAPRRRIG